MAWDSHRIELPTINNQDELLLQQPFTKEEVTKAINGLRISAGPDVISPKLYVDMQELSTISTEVFNYIWNKQKCPDSFCELI